MEIKVKSVALPTGKTRISDIYSIFNLTQTNDFLNKNYAKLLYVPFWCFFLSWKWTLG